MARELTKRHEEQVGPTVGAALAHFRATPPLGECTLVIGGAPMAAPAWEDGQLKGALADLMAEGLSARDACQRLAEQTGHRRRELYALLHRSELGETKGSLP